jgi:hypothetical protein
MKKGNPIALLPIGVFLGIYLGLGLTFEYVLHIEMGFYKVPIIIAFLTAILVACLQNRKVSFEDKLTIMGQGVGDKNIITMLLIFLTAGAFVGVVGRSSAQSVAYFMLSIIPARFAVAVLFVVAGVLSFLTANFGMLIPYGDLGMLLNYLPKVLFVFCWLSLAFMAVNKAAKVAAFIGTGTMAVYFRCNMPALMMNNFAICIVALVVALGLSYAVSLIVRNCEMTRTSRTWINLLALYYVFNFSVFFFGFCFMQEWIDQYEGLFHPVLQQVFTFSPYYTTLVLIQVLLVTFAYWKLARCEAFSGKYDAEAVPNFSPMNKWMAMAVIVPVVIVVALAVIYNNCTWFI